MPAKKRKKRKKTTGNELKKLIWIATFFIVIVATGLIFYLDYQQFRNNKNAIFQKLYTSLNLSPRIKSEIPEHVNPVNRLTETGQPEPGYTESYQEKTPAMMN